MILIKDLAEMIGIDRSTALKAIKKMGGVKIQKVKVKGVGSLVSAIDESCIELVEAHFGVKANPPRSNKLTRTEGDILVMLYLQEKTLEEVASIYNITRTCVRERQSKALRRLIGFELDSLN